MHDEPVDERAASAPISSTKSSRIAAGSRAAWIAWPAKVAAAKTTSVAAPRTMSSAADAGSGAKSGATQPASSSGSMTAIRSVSPKHKVNADHEMACRLSSTVRILRERAPQLRNCHQQRCFLRQFQVPTTMLPAPIGSASSGGLL